MSAERSLSMILEKQEELTVVASAAAGTSDEVAVASVAAAEATGSEPSKTKEAAAPHR